MSDHPYDEAQAALAQARRAAKRGDLAAADRWSKTAERLSLTLDRLRTRPETPAEAREREAEAEAMREELLARLNHLAEYGRERTEWEQERMVHDALTAFAAEHGCPPPPPLRKCPISEAELAAIAAGEAWAKRQQPPRA